MLNRIARPPEGASLLGSAQGSLGVVGNPGRRGIPVRLLANHNLPARPRFSSPSLEAEYLPGLPKRHEIHGWAWFPGGHPEAETIARNRVRTVEEPEVDAIAGQFPAGIGYTGLTEIELKRDRRAGVEFPARMWRHSSRDRITPVRALKRAM